MFFFIFTINYNQIIFVFRESIANLTVLYNTLIISIVIYYRRSYCETHNSFPKNH